MPLTDKTLEEEEGLKNLLKNTQKKKNLFINGHLTDKTLNYEEEGNNFF